MNILVLNCDFDRNPNTNGGEVIRRILKGIGASEVDVKSAFHGRLPGADRLLLYDAVIITGSNASAYEGRAWIRRLECSIRIMDRVGVPVLGICFGFQVVAKALGGNVAASGTYVEGFGPVRITASGAASPLFAGVPSGVRVYESHGDIVTRLPVGARVLAKSDNCIESYSIHSFACVQFHPEVLPDTAMLMAARDHKDPSAILAGVKRSYRLPNEIIRNFLGMHGASARTRAGRGARSRQGRRGPNRR